MRARLISGRDLVIVKLLVLIYIWPHTSPHSGKKMIISKTITTGSDTFTGKSISRKNHKAFNLATNDFRHVNSFSSSVM